MSEINHCGTCNACCKVFAIPEMQKPAGKWCKQCIKGVGCDVYKFRPERCSDFSCLWLLSQTRADPQQRLGPELRPDRCGIVFSPSTDPSIMVGTTMHTGSGAEDRPAVASLIKTLVRASMAVVIGAPNTTRKTMITYGGTREVRMTPPDENGMQWAIPEAGTPAVGIEGHPGARPK